MEVIEGVSAEGIRFTHTIPAGAQGNERPIVTTTDRWMSPEHRVMNLSKTNDPRSGEFTTRLTNISRAEPDPALFQPPPDYTIVDEKDEFEIRWGTQTQ